MRGLFTLLIFVLVSGTTTAQDYSIGDKRILLRSISFQAGFYNDDYQGSVEDFKSISQNSEALNQDYSDFEYLTGRPHSNSSFYSVLLGFDLLSRDKQAYRFNPMIKIGISYFHAIALENSLHSRTLTSSKAEFSDGPTGPVVQGTIAEDHTSSDRFELQSQQLRLNGRFLLQSSQISRLSVYGGMGFTLGHSIRTKLEIYSHENTVTEYINADGEVLSTYYNYQIDAEAHDAQGHFVSSLYLPLGLAFRVSKKTEVLSRLRLYYEVSPEIRWTSIPEIGTISQNSFHYAGGIEFKI